MDGQLNSYTARSGSRERMRSSLPEPRSADRRTDRSVASGSGAERDPPTPRIEKAPGGFSRGPFRERGADQAWLGFFILALLVFFLSEATFLVAFFFFATFFFGVVCSVCACACVISGTVDAATNESRSNPATSAFLTSPPF